MWSNLTDSSGIGNNFLQDWGIRRSLKENFWWCFHFGRGVQRCYTLTLSCSEDWHQLLKFVDFSYQILVSGLCILLLDEVDALCPRRYSSSSSSHSVRVTVQILSLLQQANATPGLVVIATTNKPNSLDPCVRRPGRLETEVSMWLLFRGKKSITFTYKSKSSGLFFPHLGLHQCAYPGTKRKYLESFAPWHGAGTFGHRLCGQIRCSYYSWLCWCWLSFSLSRRFIATI